MTRRYKAEPFRSIKTGFKTVYAVIDLQTNQYAIEPNGMVAICKDQKAVSRWAKYLNDNLPYENPISDKPFMPIMKVPQSNQFSGIEISTQGGIRMVEAVEKERFVANATLIEIRRDGAQHYKLDREVHGWDTLWITGWPRVSNVKVGAKGKIVYRSAKGYGLHFFVEEENDCNS